MEAIDMREFDTDQEMFQQIQLEDCMFSETPRNVVYYDGEQQYDRGGNWQMKESGMVLSHVSMFANCSPTLSRSSSQLSTGSDSSLSYDNCGDFSPPPPPPRHRRSGGIYHEQLKAAASFCSPLSELQRARIRNCSNSSLQSFESDDFDSSRTDLIMATDTSRVTRSQEELNYSILQTDLNSFEFVESMLGHHGSTEFSDWNPSTRQHCLPSSSHEDALSSPINVLDFPDSFTTASSHADSTSHYLDDSPTLLPQQQQEEVLTEMPSTSTSFSINFSVGDMSSAQQAGQSHSSWMSLNGDHHHQSKSTEGVIGTKDFFHQHLSSEISFQNCHSFDPTAGGGGEFQPHAAPQLGIKSDEDLDGIRLVHLLLAGAEAVASMNVDLASVILIRLKELVSRSGSTMQRVAACFCEGLQCRIEGLNIISPDIRMSTETQNDSLSAFQVLHEVSPYIKFAHFTANQAILEAFEGEKRVHIIDYDILEGIQWPSLMQALACRAGGPPHLRVTALCRPHAKRALAVTQETGKRLTEFAASFNIPFSFHHVRIDNEEEFRPSLLKQVKGECLAVNCMVDLPHMPHRSKKSLTSFLKTVHRLTPKVLTLVAEELSSSSSNFIGHFFEALHHYSAIFDSLEASLSSESRGRQLVERIFLAPRITSLMTLSSRSISTDTSGPPTAVGCALSCSDGGASERSEGDVHWHSIAQTEGFHPVPLSVYNHCQAKLLLGLFRDGYKVEEEQNRLLLGWRSKVLLGASVWQCTR